MRYWGAVLATALVALPLVAAAQPISGLYVGGGVGADIPQDTRVTPGAPSIGGAGHLRLNQEDVGLTGIGAVGYGLGNGVRFEVQGDFLRNGIDQLGRMPFPASNKGTVRTYGLMANALYDMNIGVPWLYPYIGVGGGYQWTHLDGFNAVQAGGPFSVSSDDTRGKPAAQVIVGASMPISGVPGLSLTADYRFMKIWGGEKFNTTEIPVGGGAPVNTTLKLGNQYDHIFLFGVRYAFNAPAAPPPPIPAAQPAPAPAPSRSYMVFFDWDKATLTDRAQAIIKEAADNSTRVQYTRIEVNGYTDTSGTPQYNQGLSIRRAQAVAGELVRDGVPQSSIGIQGFGETHLLVPTGAGVREPQNRRVEIIIH